MKLECVGPHLNWKLVSTDMIFKGFAKFKTSFYLFKIEEQFILRNTTQWMLQCSFFS